LAAKEDLRNIYQRLAAAMEEVTYIQKEQKAGMRYSIVSHDDVTAKVRPALLKQGIVYFPMTILVDRDGNLTQMHLTTRFVNIDDPTQTFDVQTLGYGVDNQDKGPGKAMSYAIKYALLKTMGLETGDDPDLDHETTRLDNLASWVSRIEGADSLEEMERIKIDVSRVIDGMGDLEKSAIREAAKKKEAALA
jgi:hypothetical protein